MAEAVRTNGTRLPDEDLSPSEAIVPPPDLTLEEARELFEGEGLIPDLPGRLATVTGSRARGPTHWVGSEVPPAARCERTGDLRACL